MSSSLFSAAISSLLGVPSTSFPSTPSPTTPIPSSTTTSEIIKNTIINEIEESLLGNKNNSNILRTKANQVDNYDFF